ncbi:molecular chaperone [Caballeronia sp. LZ062]|uniref:fimbrial biogenesis chaperone n=1 Tax=unclassified Caballeronia TaxID=2646786 RepID=UPI002862D46E|nr:MULTISPECIES: molecular chaperone [unclassified Caballeronia]MDR5856295.1 molecular chaperone [Caballeronia sp. LZ050]MDR5872965.1 molecular chaperone [Caballeronia sp. LZ062]
MRQLRTLALLVLPTFLIASAHAASLQISPVSIALDATEAGKVLNLRNESDTAIHAQVRVFAWDQADEDERLTPTRDLLASPPIAEIPAGGQQVIRVIRSNRDAPEHERAYRLLIDELPPEGANAGNGVQFRFRYSVPLFVAPAGEPAPPELHWSIVEKSGQPYLRVSNSGKIHARLSAVSLTISAAKVPVAAGLLGYVLAGRARSWPLSNASHAARARSGEVTATVNGNGVTAPLMTNAAP